MQLSANDTIGYGMLAEDGEEVGTVDDLMFDDESSAVRYLVINAGSWLSERMVLLTPAAFSLPDPDTKSFQTALTKEQVKDSPPIDTEKPVSRQQEEALHGHFGWTPYWDSPLVPGVGAAYWGGMPVFPKSNTDAAARDMAIQTGADGGNPHLRSAREVMGYYIGAKDGDIGHVDDLLIDEENWAIRYLVIDTRNWLPGKKVLVATNWLKAVDWHEQKIEVDLERDKIKSSPEYDPTMTLDRDYHQRLHEHYGRNASWF
jgi:sporulation protein YlmC with PRC-barrel domain